MSVRTVLFDLGGVVLDWSPARLYAKLIPDAAERQHFLTHVCSMAWHTKHDAGASFANNAAALTRTFPEHRALIEAWSARWMEMFDGYVTGTPELMDRLGTANIPLYALTNMPSDPWPQMQTHFSRMAMFDDVIVSGDEKCLKPDAKIFHIALARMGNPAPDSVFFIDDSAANIAAADTLGFITHHFKSAAGLESALIKHKLIS